jgi:hypothetical protein
VYAVALGKLMRPLLVDEPPHEAQILGGTRVTWST